MRPKIALFDHFRSHVHAHTCDHRNTSSRMESTCRYGCIQISEATRTLLPHHPFTPTGVFRVYFWRFHLLLVSRSCCHC